jgi:hypothetical protein
MLAVSDNISTPAVTFVPLRLCASPCVLPRSTDHRVAFWKFRALWTNSLAPRRRQWRPFTRATPCCTPTDIVGLKSCLNTQSNTYLYGSSQLTATPICANPAFLITSEHQSRYNSFRRHMHTLHVRLLHASHIDRSPMHTQQSAPTCIVPAVGITPPDLLYYSTSVSRQQRK